MRIYVTGLGALSCLGESVVAHREAFRRGWSGIRQFGHARQGLPHDGYGGLVCGYPEKDDLSRGARMLGQVINEAWMQAGLPQMAAADVFIGSAHGNLDLWKRARERGDAVPARRLWDVRSPALEAIIATPRVSIFSTACTASSVAVKQAMSFLQTGRASLAVVAGFDLLSEFVYRGFSSLKSLASTICRPFDRNRDGLTLGEGAAAIVMETEKHLMARGGMPLAELVACGFSADGVHLTAPDPCGRGACTALRTAMTGVQDQDKIPAFINLHGTGTHVNDLMEGKAVQRVFGERADQIALTSTKPLTGHLCGAAGIMEVLSTILSLQDRIVPPVLGLTEPDEELAGLSFVTGRGRVLSGNTAVTMNSGFGGTNTAIYIRSHSA